VGHVLWELFNWPGGITVGNLIVDSLFAIPSVIAFVKLHRKLDRHHEWHIGKAKSDS
jgi:hypothetical protein